MWRRPQPPYFDSDSWSIWSASACLELLELLGLWMTGHGRQSAVKRSRCVTVLSECGATGQRGRGQVRQMRQVQTIGITLRASLLYLCLMLTRPRRHHCCSTHNAHTGDHLVSDIGVHRNGILTCRAWRRLTSEHKRIDTRAHYRGAHACGPCRQAFLSPHPKMPVPRLPQWRLASSTRTVARNVPGSR